MLPRNSQPRLRRNQQNPKLRWPDRSVRAPAHPGTATAGSETAQNRRDAAALISCGRDFPNAAPSHGRRLLRHKVAVRAGAVGPGPPFSLRDRPAPAALFPWGPPCSGRSFPVGTALLRPPFSCCGRKMLLFWWWLCCGRARPQQAAARGRGSSARLAASPMRSSERERCVGSVADKAVCFGKQNHRVVWLGKGL